MQEEMYLKTEEGRKTLDGSSLLYAKELRLGVSLSRSCAKEQIFQPMERRSEELAEYRQARCVFRKNPDPAKPVVIADIGAEAIRMDTPLKNS